MGLPKASAWAKSSSALTLRISYSAPKLRKLFPVLWGCPTQCLNWETQVPLLETKFQGQPLLPLSKTSVHHPIIGDPRHRRDSLKLSNILRRWIDTDDPSGTKGPDPQKVQVEERNLIWLPHGHHNCWYKNTNLKLRVIFYLVKICRTSSPGNSISSNP